MNRSMNVRVVSACMLAWLLAAGAHAQVETNIAYAKRDANNDFYADDLFTTYGVRGRITSPNFATNRTEIFIQDTNDNIGIQVLGAGFILDTNTYRPGYEVYAEGLIAQSNGLRSINPTFSFLLVVTDPTEVHPAPVADTLTNLLAVAETNEGRLVEVAGVAISAGAWPGFGSSASITVTDTTGQIVMRIDADVDLDGQLPPTNEFTLRGIFSQFDITTNANSGYQIQPRYYSDLVQSVGVEPPALVILNSNALYSVDAGQTLAIDVLGQDRNAEDDLVFSLAEAPGAATLSDIGYRLARFQWTPDEGDRGSLNTVTFAVTDGVTTTEVTVSVYVLTEEQAAIVLNEVHWDPAAGSAGDANGDGVRDAAADEFVEIVNNNAFDVDFSGYRLLFGTDALHEFEAGTIVTAETAVVIFGEGQTPAGQFGNAQVFVSTQWAGLANSPGTRNVSLRDSADTQLFSHNYSSFGEPDQSITRNPDITGGFVLHLNANPAKRWSPGTLASGAGFPGSGLTNTAPAVAAIGDTFVQVGAVRAIGISATDVESNGITLTMSNAPATAVLVDNLDGTGLFVYTGAVADAGATFNVLVYASDGSDASSELFQLYVVAEQYAGLVINEVMFDPTNTVWGHLDGNNDGVFDQNQDEYVEIVNGTTNAIDLTGFRIHDDVSVRHIFSSVVIPTGGFIVVFGGGSIANFSNQPAQVASSGSLGLNNGAPDSAILLTPQTQIVDRITTDVNAAPVYWDGQSLTRSNDFTGTFTNHFAANPSLAGSPGRRITGALFLADQPPTIAPIGNQVVADGQALQFGVTATDVDGDPITLVASNVPSGAAFGATNGVGLFTWAAAGPAGDYVVTFHAFDLDGFDSVTVTITVVEAATDCGLIISEYVEGSSNNKALELYNATPYPIDLLAGQYTIVGHNNGAAFTSQTYVWALTGTVAAGETYIVGSSSAGATLLALMHQSFGGANWNGDDAIVLRMGGTNGPIVDSFGQVGVDPGTTWGSGTNLTVDKTLRRKFSVTAGDVVADNAFDPTVEWEFFPIDTIDGVGSHTNNCSLVDLDDLDGDRLPNDWETLYFGGATNADASADGDLDGFSNLEEFIALTNPQDDESYLRVADISNAVDRVVSVDSVTGRVYSMRVLTNLLTDAPGAALPGSVTGTGARVSLTDTNEGASRHYRIGVKLE